MRTTRRSISSSMEGRPIDLRNFDPSNFLAISSRYQRSSVSGIAAAATSARAFLPNRWAISANVVFSESDSNNRPLIFALRIRFSAARYSFRSSSSWSTVPVIYVSMRVQIIDRSLVFLWKWDSTPSEGFEKRRHIVASQKLLNHRESFTSTDVDENFDHTGFAVLIGGQKFKASFILLRSVSSNSQRRELCSS